MESLRIRAYLQTAIISDQFLPIDGILFYMKCREEFGHLDVTEPGSSAVSADAVTLPLQKRNENLERWYYAASFARWPDHTVQGKENFSKRFRISYANMIDFDGKRGRVYTSRGQYKSYFIEVYYRHAIHVDWYVCGDADEILRLLQHCTHLGKKTSQGWGQILRWQINPSEDDWSERGPSGELVRAIPDETSHYLYGYRPSYYDRRNQFSCKMP